MPENVSKIYAKKYSKNPCQKLISKIQFKKLMPKPEIKIYSMKLIPKIVENLTSMLKAYFKGLLGF